MQNPLRPIFKRLASRAKGWYDAIIYWHYEVKVEDTSYMREKIEREKNARKTEIRGQAKDSDRTFY